MGDQPVACFSRRNHRNEAKRVVAVVADTVNATSMRDHHVAWDVPQDERQGQTKDEHESERVHGIG